jgi:hypothetical protein
MLILYIEEKKANSGESPVISADTNLRVCDDLILPLFISPFSLSI